MKRLAILFSMVFAAGLFTAGAAFGMSHEDQSDMNKSRVEEQHPALGDIQTPGATDNLAARDLDEEQIRELQSILQDEGYDVGEVNGQIGTETREALRNFQRDEGLAVTGEPNDETLRALAPSADQQEFFGLSPEFGTEKEGVMEKKEWKENETTPTGEEKSGESPRTNHKY